MCEPEHGVEVFIYITDLQNKTCGILKGGNVHDYS